MSEVTLSQVLAALADELVTVRGRGPRAIANELRANAERLREGERDAERLAYLRHEFDELGGIDLHDRASLYASAFGRDEPNEADYTAAVRDAIDASRSGRDGVA